MSALGPWVAEIFGQTYFWVLLEGVLAETDIQTHTLSREDCPPSRVGSVYVGLLLGCYSVLV